MTYRDELMALRERWRDEREHRDREVASLGPLVAGVRALEARFDRDATPLAFRVPDPPFAPLPPIDEHATREEIDAALARLAEERAEIEDEKRWLAGRRRSLEGGVDRAPLGPPPRVVPFRLGVAEALGLSWRMGFVAVPLAWVARVTLGRGGVALLVVLFAVVLALRVVRRLAFLRRGVVAETRVVGTRSTSTQMTNWPTRRARGWVVDSISFTGGGSVLELAARTESGAEVPVRLRDVSFHEGVVLVLGSRALATLHLHCAPVPTPEGAWAPKLTRLAWRSVMLGLLAWLLMLGPALR